MSRDDTCLLDMLLAARRTLEAARGLSFEQFSADWKVQSIVQYQLMLLGEAVKRLSREFRDRYPDIPWQAIAGHRDILIHQYDAVDLSEVWAIVTDKLPPLLAFLESVAPKPGAGQA
jgi:uncharacterized protein with HEPN domain